MSLWQAFALYITAAALTAWLGPLLFGVGEDENDPPPAFLGLLWPIIVVVLAVALPTFALNRIGKIALRLRRLTASKAKDTHP